MSLIAVVGNATVDIINYVSHYPHEDEEMRAFQQEIRRGGNAANTAVVLAQLGHKVEWIGTLGSDLNVGIITNDFSKYGVGYSQAQIIQNGVTPTSYIALNQQNGSRTIIHYRDLTELEAVSLQSLSACEWIHFEGRNVSVLVELLKQIRKINQPPFISIEFEKERGDELKLLQYCNLAIFSRSYFSKQGQAKPEESILRLPKNTDLAIVCTWGKEGSFIRHDGKVVRVPTKVEVEQIDSVGAGDTFNAGLIHARLKNMNWEDALNFANCLAAKKIAQKGFSGLIED